MNRRDFLRLASLTPVASMLPSALRAKETAVHNKIVVLLELRGGNDALNTLIPYTDPLYYTLRPKLAIKENKVLRLNHQLGMHPEMQKLIPYWKSGEMAWLQGVGYPHPNRSHFRSMEIWNTASDSHQHLKQGWVSRLFAGHDHINGVSVSEPLGPLSGNSVRSLRIGSPEGFLRRAERMDQHTTRTRNDALAHILNTEKEVVRSANDLGSKLHKTRSLSSHFPNNALGEKLASVSRLIISGAKVPAYKVGLGSFDTHVLQSGKHSGLLRILSENLDAFAKVLKQHHRWQDVVVVTYSEFGRKAKENGSNGTDHGVASSHFVMGGKVNGGFYGRMPSLSDLDNDAMKHNLDFRSVYATLSERWWQKDSLWKHPPIPFV